MVLAMAMFCSIVSGSDIDKILLACCEAKVVLPQYLGPSIKTAPIASSFSAKILSAILALYSFIFICILFVVTKVYHFSEYQASALVLIERIDLFVVAVGAFLLWQLARYFSKC